MGLPILSHNWFKLVVFFISVFKIMSSHDLLDETWVQELQKIQDIKQNYCKESMDSISVHSIFINTNKHIDKIVNLELALSKHDTIENHMYLSKNTLSSIIQQNKEHKGELSKRHYKLIDIASFFVTIEPEHIQSYSKTDPHDLTHDFFKIHPYIEDIHVPMSIFIFHKLNSIFLIYQEVTPVSNNRTMKSILKKTSNKNCKTSHTKKVKINTELNETYRNVHKKHTKTRRCRTKTTQ
jgi:hypothetical protein